MSKTVRINGGSATFTRLDRGWCVEIHRRSPRPLTLPVVLRGRTFLMMGQSIWGVFYGSLADLRRTAHRLMA